MGKYNVEDQDDYLLENNLFGAESREKLEQLESVAFSIRSSQLETTGFDWLIPLSIVNLKKLHEFLFQDVYPFAGGFRDVQLMKGQTRFCQAEFIESNLQKLCLRLENDYNWKTKEEAAKKLAYYKAELNMIHPFRDGNAPIRPQLQTA